MIIIIKKQIQEVLAFTLPFEFFRPCFIKEFIQHSVPMWVSSALFFFTFWCSIVAGAAQPGQTATEAQRAGGEDSGAQKRRRRGDKKHVVLTKDSRSTV